MLHTLMKLKYFIKINVKTPAVLFISAIVPSALKDPSGRIFFLPKATKLELSGMVIK